MFVVRNNNIRAHKNSTSDVAGRYTSELADTSSIAYDPKTRSPGTWHNLKD